MLCHLLISRKGNAFLVLYFPDAVIKLRKHGSFCPLACADSEDVLGIHEVILLEVT